MDVILLERVSKLGNLGDVVTVKDGYARNFLIPSNKALRANAENKKLFEARRQEIEKNNEQAKLKAEEFSKTFEGKTFNAIRQAGDTGILFGSVSAKDIAEILNENGFEVKRQQVDLNSPIKSIGIFDVNIKLHADVEVIVKFNVARSNEEAEQQLKGETFTSVEKIESEFQSGFDNSQLDENAQ